MNAFALFDAMEGPLKPVLDPRVYVQPRDRDPASEDDRQAISVATLRRVAPKIRVEGNANAAKRSRWAAAKVKREGLVKGRNDIDVKWAPARLAVVEFKAGRTMPGPDQIEYLNAMVGMGFPAAICRTCEGMFAWLRSIGAPVPEARP